MDIPLLAYIQQPTRVFVDHCSVVTTQLKDCIVLLRMEKHLQKETLRGRAWGCCKKASYLTHRIHVWFFYLHEWLIHLVIGKHSLHGSCGFRIIWIKGLLHMSSLDKNGLITFIYLGKFDLNHQAK